MENKPTITRAGAYALADRIRKAVRLSNYNSHLNINIYNFENGGYTVSVSLRDAIVSEDKVEIFDFYSFRTKEENEAEFGRMVQFLKRFDK